MLGLPDITVFVVGGAVVVALLLLFYWGMTFTGHDD